MVFFGYSQNTGGYAYYYSGKKGLEQQREKEEDTDKPDFEVKDTNIIDEGDDGTQPDPVPDKKEPEMENIVVKVEEKEEKKEE